MRLAQRLSLHVLENLKGDTPAVFQHRLPKKLPCTVICDGGVRRASGMERNNLEAVKQRIGELNSAPPVPPSSPTVVVISGQSGVGKDSVIKKLRERRPDLHFVVTATTRPMREGEVDGVDYIFVSKDKFEEWLKEGKMLEHAVVYGEYKGIPRQQVNEALSKGTDVILRLDVQGAATVRSLIPDSVSIFLAAESEEGLVTRLLGRNTEATENLLIRVETARKEAQRIKEFDYVVINREGDIEDAVSKISAILDAEKCSVNRRLRERKTGR